VAVVVRVEVRVWTWCWLMRMVVRVALVDGSRKWRRRNGRGVVSGARARRGGGMMPMIERGRRAGCRVRACMGGWRGALRGKDATKDKTEAMKVSVVVGVVLHCGWMRRVLRVVRHELEELVDGI